MSYSYSKEQTREIHEKGDKPLNILSKKWERNIKIYEDYQVKEIQNNQNIKENDLIKENNKIPKNIKFVANLTEDSMAEEFLDNTFNVFKSTNNILCLVYTNSFNSIICYNLIDKKKINEIKNAHQYHISNFRYFLDKENKRDLILSISRKEDNAKLWNINNLECLLDIINIHETDYILSACFLRHKNDNYIITINCSYPYNYEIIKIFDFDGNKVKQISQCNYPTNFIESYYDNKLLKSYIITGCDGFVKSYDYNKNKIYHLYSDDNNNEGHFSIIINDTEEIVKLIGSSYDGKIRVWNFHSGELMFKIIVGDNKLYGICLWNNEYLFVGEKEIKLIDLKNGIIVNDLIGHNSLVLTIKKIILPQYGECLLSQSWPYNQIKLWTYES